MTTSSSSDLPTIAFGTTGMDITRVGFGAWAVGGTGWSGGWGPQDDTQSIAAIRRAVPEMTVGAGTILTPEQVNVARDAGAAFLVSPGFGPSVVRRAAEVGLPILPGACTPTEIQAALEAGIRVVKFFPAEAAGGIPYLRALTGPFRDVGFVPTGGIDAGNLAEYLAVPGVLACGGSWFVRKEWIAAGDFAAVTAAAREAAAIVTRARRG